MKNEQMYQLKEKEKERKKERKNLNEREIKKDRQSCS
jgi:hypothetical protein